VAFHPDGEPLGWKVRDLSEEFRKIKSAPEGKGRDPNEWRSIASRRCDQLMYDTAYAWAVELGGQGVSDPGAGVRDSRMADRRRAVPGVLGGVQGESRVWTGRGAGGRAKQLGNQRDVQTVGGSGLRHVSRWYSRKHLKGRTSATSGQGTTGRRWAGWSDRTTSKNAVSGGEAREEREREARSRDA
jgi:hypothetical protein